MTRPATLACPHAGLILAPTGEAWLVISPRADAIPMTPPFEVRTSAGNWWTPIPGSPLFNPQLAQRPSGELPLTSNSLEAFRTLRFALPIPYPLDEDPPVVYIRCADNVSASSLANKLAELSWQARGVLLLNKLELDSLNKLQQTKLAMLSNITPVILTGMTFHQADLIHRVTHQRRVAPVIILYIDNLLVVDGVCLDASKVYDALNQLGGRAAFSRFLLHNWAMRRYESIQFGMTAPWLPWE